MLNNNVTDNLFLHQKVTVVFTNYTVLPDDVILSVNTSAPRLITLPAPSTKNRGKFFIIKDSSGNAATHNMTIKSAAGLIDQKETLSLSSNYGSIEVYSNGTDYLSANPFELIGDATSCASGGWVKYAPTAFTPGVTKIQARTSDAPMEDSARLDFSDLTVVTPIVNLQIGTQNITFIQSGLYHIIAQAVVNLDVSPMVQLVKNNQEVTCSFITSSALKDYQELSIFYTDNYVAGDVIDFRFGTWQGKTPYQFYTIACFVQQLPMVCMP